MTLQASTLRPGFLVSLNTRVVGNVHYIKNTIESEHVVDGGAQKAKWETTRFVNDPAENEKSKVARGRARSAITSVCANTSFGLLCPEASALKLEQAIAEARKIADKFNAEAKQTRLDVYVITGRVAPDDVEAVRAINSEVRGLLSDMENGIKNLDAKAIREAASQARRTGTMLSADAYKRVEGAIEAVRGAARKITKAGDQISVEIDKAVLSQLAEARTAFLELDEVGEVAAPAVSAPTLDMTPGFELKAAPSQFSNLEV